MDLAKIKPIEAKLNLRNPANNKETGMILTIACSHDDRVKKATREINDKLLSLGKDITEEQLSALDNEMAAACIFDVEFTGDSCWEGERPKFSKSLAIEICSIQSLKEQVLAKFRSTQDFYTP